MRTHAAIGIVLLAVLCPPALAAEAPPPAGPVDTSGWIGSNYTPAYCSNQVQLWHDFRPEAIEKELEAAATHFAVNTLRVYLHNMVYDAEKEEFLGRIEAFIALCARRGIRPGFTFFDDCWNHAGVTLEPQPPVPGRHNGRWAALQDAQRQDENLPRFKAYVQDVVRAHRQDTRVLWWEVYNEPNMNDPFTAKIREAAYAWIKECRPDQPVIACWDDSPQTDIVDAHNYGDDFGLGGAWDRQADLNPRKGTVFTEAGARWYARKPSSNGSPVEVIRWLRGRRARGLSVPGVYLCWELMVGNSHCRWYWGTPDGTPEPAVPWCGLLWPDGTPVSLAEAEAVRAYATGKPRAMLFDDFEAAPAEPDYPNWKRFGQAGAGSRYLRLSGHVKTVAGQADWADYVLEAAVMLKDAGGNAGLVFRANDPGPGPDQMRGYYAGFDLKTLYLGKMNNDWKPLATFDLSKLASRMETDTWNLLRVAVRGNTIRVWFNRTHGDDGLRIEYTDAQDPVLKGNVGCRVQGTSAWFDDVVVLPVDVLPN